MVKTTGGNNPWIPMICRSLRVNAVPWNMQWNFSAYNTDDNKKTYFYDEKSLFYHLLKIPSSQLHFINKINLTVHNLDNVSRPIMWKKQTKTCRLITLLIWGSRIIFIPRSLHSFTIFLARRSLAVPKQLAEVEIVLVEWWQWEVSITLKHCLPQILRAFIILEAIISLTTPTVIFPFQETPRALNMTQK